MTTLPDDLSSREYAKFVNTADGPAVRVAGSSDAFITGATSIAANEDDASADLDTGVKILAIQKAIPANTAGTDGDYMMLQVSGGRLWVSANIDKINGVTPLMGNGITGTGSQRVTIASDNIAFSVNATLSAETTKVIGTINIAAAQITTLTPPAAITGFALEAGHLATIDTSTAKIPSQGQALAAASLPVVLTAIQQTALTPPAAITGFALDATLTGRTQKTQITDGTRDGTVKAASTLPAATDTALVVTLRESLSTPVTGTFWQATQPVSGTVSITANSAVNVAQINGVTPLMGNGITGTGSQRVTIASDNTAFSVNATLAAETTKVIGTINIAAAQTLATVSTITNLAQQGGVAISLNTGVRDTGTQRVTIATNDIVPVSQSGTWTVQPGNTANTTAWKVDGSAVTQPVSGTITSTNETVSTAVLANVTASATSVTALASSASRKAAYFFNDSSSFGYLKFGATASVTSFTVKIDPFGYYEIPQPVYTGIIDMIHDSATGTMRVTSL